MYTTSLDGGWGWVVVASAFVAQMLSDGISYGFGILYVDLMETFGGTSAEISSIGSLSYGSFCFIGPVAGVLTNKLGYRCVTIVGAFLQALGVFLSAFTPKLEFLYFSVGILIGVGGGMMYIASFVCVSAYFVSKRPLATSISSCGSSAGTFLFGFLYRLCIDYYGWRGALVVFSGLMLNGVVCGVLFRPFTAKPAPDVIELDVLEETCNKIVCETPQQDATRRTNAAEMDTEEKPRNGSVTSYSSSQNIDSFVHKHETLFSNQLEEKGEKFDDDKYDLVEDACDNLLAAENRTGYNLIDKSALEFSDVSSHGVDSKSECKVGKRTRLKSLISLVLGTTDLKIFTEWPFVLYGISTFLYCFGYGIPFVLLPDMAERNGFTPSEAAWVISEFGMAAVVGKFFFGALSQTFTKKDSRANTKINSIAVILSGVAIACAPWTYSFAVLLVIGGGFGFLSAAGSTLATVILIELLGDASIADSLGWTNFIGGIGFIGGPIIAAAVNTLVTLVLIELLGGDRLADAFGWLNFFGGIGYITGPVVAGWLYDVTSDYVATFITAGVSLALAGIVLIPVFIPGSLRILFVINSVTQSGNLV